MSPEQIIDQALVRYERPLISYASGITGNLEAARDAVQETFLRLSRQDVLKLEPRLAQWLFFVCRNCALDHHRKNARFVQDADEQIAKTSAQTPSPDVQMETDDDSSHLRRLLNNLPSEQRELVKLRFEGGLTYREIGDVTRMSISNVSLQIHLALQTLRDLWEKTEAMP
ncbi:MAG: sigma-70 family RNA polymerase sigma factor [Chthoniobacterales bacterium]